MNIKAIGIAVLILLMGVGISQLHIGEQNVTPALTFAPSQNLKYSAPLQSSTYYPFGLDYPCIGHVYITLNRLGGTYLIENHHVILSSLTPSGTSSMFSDVLYFNFTQTSAEWTLSGDPTFALTIIVNYSLELRSGTFVQQQSQTTTLTQTQGYGAGSSSSGPIQILNSADFTGEVTGLAITNVVIKVDNTNNFAYDVFNNFVVQLQTQNYVEPSGGSLSISSQYNGIIEDGSQININFQTLYSTGYQILVYGSPAYNNGGQLKTYQVNANANSYVIYTLPNNAWKPNAGTNGNLWKIKLVNNLMGVATTQFFAVDNYSLMPGSPTITILNTPSGGIWTVGQTVNVKVHSNENSVTNASIKTFSIFVYTSNTQTGGQNYILDGTIIPATNGYGNFSFTIQNNQLNFYIEASAYDVQGRNSQITSISIQASQIKNPGEILYPIQLILVVIISIMMIVGSILFYLYLPYDPFSKTIIISSYIISLLMIYVGAGGIL